MFWTVLLLHDAIYGNYRVITLFSLYQPQFIITWREYGELSLNPIFHITYRITKKYYPGEPVNIHIESLINSIHDNNMVITTKKG